MGFSGWTQTTISLQLREQFSSLINIVKSLFNQHLNTSLRTGLGIALYHDNTKDPWTCELVDIEAAFLEGKLTAPTYIQIPRGMVELGFMKQKEYEDNCIELLGGM